MCNECKDYFSDLDRRYKPRWWQRLWDLFTEGEEEVASAGISG